VEPEQTKNRIVQMREDGERLEYLAAELRAEDKERMRLLSAAVGILLASEDFICCDLMEQLKDAKSYLAGSLPDAEGAVAEESASETDAVIEEAVSEPEKPIKPFLKMLLSEIEEILGRTTAMQRRLQEWIQGLLREGTRRRLQ